VKKVLIIILSIVLFTGSIVFAGIKSFNRKYSQHNDSRAEEQPKPIPGNIAYEGGDVTEIINVPGGNSESESGSDSDSGTLNAIASGPVKEVPWENEDTFKEALMQSGATTILAAFRTVLKDPLPGEEFNVHLAARMLAGTILKPQEIFSQNKLLGPYTESRGYQEGPTYMGSRLAKTYGGGVCKIASTLYNVSVLSNLQIIERHAHSMPVPYVPYGQDATVAYGAKDFKFKNTSNSQILIWAMGVDNILYIAFYGSYIPPKIEWKHNIIETSKAPVIYKTNSELSELEEKIILEGMDGAVVKSWIIIENRDGTNEIKQMGTSYYSPMPHIIERRQ